MNKQTSTKKWVMCGVLAVLAIVGAKYSQDLRTSPQGLQLIANAEGCVRNPYQCPSDVLTVGIGTTDNVEKIKPNKIYSHDEIARLYAKGIKQAEQCVNQHANGQAMPQGAFDALVSITYNVGCGKMQKSTLFKLAKQGYSPAMCDQFPRWVYSNGKPLKGLIERRKKERDLCLDG
ncbi:lysozyme [Avibacterium paragallinarum]|nr:lysozyme [Avibacterium paragallinarum]WAM59339.1 lysozyme [Avibacterium paragallinarum]